MPASVTLRWVDASGEPEYQEFAAPTLASAYEKAAEFVHTASTP